MDQTILWIIIIAFYAPLHYMLPVLILFITGNEPEDRRKALIRGALIDSTVSMVIAFTLAIALVQMDLMIWAMLVLLLSMPLPFVRIFRHRREISG
jgi:hydrogenase-4 membrane subunit HyfE